MPTCLNEPVLVDMGQRFDHVGRFPGIDQDQSAFVVIGRRPPSGMGRQVCWKIERE